MPEPEEGTEAEEAGTHPEVKSKHRLIVRQVAHRASVKCPRCGSIRYRLRGSHRLPNGQECRYQDCHACGLSICVWLAKP
jgi:hypothetical protein